MPRRPLNPTPSASSSKRGREPGFYPRTRTKRIFRELFFFGTGHNQRNATIVTSLREAVLVCEVLCGYVSTFVECRATAMRHAETDTVPSPRSTTPLSVVC